MFGAKVAWTDRAATSIEVALPPTPQTTGPRLTKFVPSFCYFRTLSFPACMACYGIPRAGRNAWMYSCLEKELGPSLLVERLLEHSCADKNKPH